MSAVLELPKIDEKAIALAIERRKRAVFYDVDWETYENLIENYPTRRNPKIFYNRGILELMPLLEHDNYIRILDEIFTVVAEEYGLDWENFGSATYKLEIFGRGFEPDSSYYVNENAGLMRGKKRFDLTVDPPPDLVFEIDITSSSINKFEMFAEFGVKEVWIYEDNRLKILQLKETNYLESTRSIFLPTVTNAVLTQFFDESQKMKRPEWRKKIRQLTNENLKKQ